MASATRANRLGDLIRQRRLERGWTQEQLAERISADDEYIRQSEISRIETGLVGFPRRARLERIARALDLPLGEVLAHSSWNGAPCAGCGSLVARSWDAPGEPMCARCRYEDDLILQAEHEALWANEMARMQAARRNIRAFPPRDAYKQTG